MQTTHASGLHLESMKLSKSLQKLLIPISSGLSDHTRSIGVILRAIHKYEVSAIEMHIDLDKKE